MYSIMSSAKSESFIFSFPICIQFTSLSSLIAVARTSKTMLNNSHDSGHPCLVPDLRGNVSVFHHWEWCLLWVCHIWPLLCWDMFPLCSLSGEFLSKMGVEFCQKLFLWLIWSLSFSSLAYWYGWLHWLIFEWWTSFTYLEQISFCHGG